MDFQNRPGAKTGGGGAATQGMADRFFFKENYCWQRSSLFHRERRERLAALAAETIDLAKDPYFMRYAISLVQYYDIKHLPRTPTL